MTSRILRQLQRDPKFQKQEQPPAPPLDTTQLNEALAEFIKQAAAAGAEEAIKQQPTHNPAVPVHRQPFTDKAEAHEFPAPPPKAKPPMPVVTMTRGADGKIRSASVGNLTFNVERDGAGRAMRLVPQED